MLKKAKAKAAGDERATGVKDVSERIFESSRQIWLAGLGAFSRAQAEGLKAFDTLVQQGAELETRTKRAAADTAAAARAGARAKAREVQAMAGGTWDKLEQVFERRVERALSKLGVHTQNDVQRLTERVEELSLAVNELLRKTGTQGGTRRAPRSTASKAARAPESDGKSKKSSASRHAGRAAAQSAAPDAVAGRAHGEASEARKAATRKRSRPPTTHGDG